jgi:hypothetical protein
MSFEYTYEVIAVDQAARCMEVVYSSAGRQTMHIGARLPYEGETLESVVQMYSPVAYWLEQDATVVAPQVGAIGSVTTTDPQPVDPVVACKAAAKARLEDTDWSQVADVSSALLNKAAFDTYRATVRALYFNPIAEPVWPERPEAQWAVA